MAAIFAHPINGNIEALFSTIGCEIFEGSGSRISVIFEDSEQAFHRPHPGKEALRYRVKDARDFLTKIGIEP